MAHHHLNAVYLGIDLGTTALKAILSDGRSKIYGTAEVGLTIQRPKPQWSEQDPKQWWRALVAATHQLQTMHQAAWSRLQGLSFSGQMHGVVLLAGDQVLRPCILWNDGRAVSEATDLNALGDFVGQVAGVRAMAGFSAPKLKWLAKHEPHIMAKATMVLCPKDYLRFRLTGEFATDPVDASGMWLMDVETGQWHERLVKATGLKLSQLPEIKTAEKSAGTVTSAASRATGLPRGLAVAVGTGDAAANTLGLGLISEGDGVISLGTSAQIFVSKARHVPEPSRNIHAFAHALPHLWFQMAALLNGASPLSWCAKQFFDADIAQCLRMVEARSKKLNGTLGQALFLPYLAGERTPHDAPFLRAGFFGLEHGLDKANLGLAVMEGVALSLADCADILARTGTSPTSLYAVGGGFRSSFWASMIASALGRDLLQIEAGDFGGSLGAARLARASVTAEDFGAIFVKPSRPKIIKPNAKLHDAFQKRLPIFRALVDTLML
jgi:xylulokinase